MKMKKIALAVVVAAAASAGVVGCHDSKDRQRSETTTIEVFDGFAIECNVSANGIDGEEVGNGTYRIVSTDTLPVGAVVVASNCEDLDTGALLPELRSVAQEGGVAVSPITTLIVAAALASGGDPANITAEALQTAKTAVVTNLGLTGYDPVNPGTANYVKTVATSETSQSQMQTAMAVATLLKTVEKAAGTSGDAAITAVAQAVAQATTPINLASSAAVQTLLTTAATTAGDETVAAAINTASTAAATKVAEIAAAPSVGAAAAITQAVAEVLNDPAIAVTAVATVDTTDLPPINVGKTEDGTGGTTGGTGGTGS